MENVPSKISLTNSYLSVRLEMNHSEASPAESLVGPGIAWYQVLYWDSQSAMKPLSDFQFGTDISFSQASVSSLNFEDLQDIIISDSVSKGNPTFGGV